MNPYSRVFVAGHRGLVGSAIVRALRHRGYRNLLLRTHAELDLADKAAVQRFFAAADPEYVFLAAAKVGGIHANNAYPAEFIRQNLDIQTNIIEASRIRGVKRLLFLGSSCIYPRLCRQPIQEEYLLTGPLEPTNRAYAVAKIAGIEMCWSYNRQYDTRYLAAMPCNVYGPGDNFDLDNSHVFPALIRKVIEAKQSARSVLTLWGTGEPQREFIHADDLADACIFLLTLSDSNYERLLHCGSGPMINVGTAREITICELATLISKALDYQGEIVFDSSRPDGTPRKVLDVSKMNALGWRASISLEEGVRRTCDLVRWAWMQHAPAAVSPCDSRADLSCLWRDVSASTLEPIS